jgi:hypothetical protein
MPFIAAVMSFVAERVRSVRVSNGASRLWRSSDVFFELGLFMALFVCFAAGVNEFVRGRFHVEMMIGNISF